MIRKVKKIVINFLLKLKFKRKRFCIFLRRVDISYSNLEGCNKIGSETKFISSSLGKYSYIGHNCFFIQTVIGRYCSIAKNVRIITGTHPINDFISSSPIFYSKTYPFSIFKGKKEKFSEIKYVSENIQCKIGNDVWIGEDVKIMGGVTIGDGAIIGTGSIVTKNVSPYSIVVGIPAKTIRYRFDKDIIDSLLQEQWWNLEINELSKYLKLDSKEKINNYFRNI